MNLEQCVELALQQVTPAVRARFAADPLGALRQELGLAVEAADHLRKRRNDGGACDGMSFLEDGVILYAPTPNSRRQNFTLAHEFGHWLVEQATEIYDWLADQREPARMLETVCDRIAQRLLLPAELVSSVVKRPLRASGVLDLYRASQASRPVCCIALAERLPQLGAVILLDREAESVAYASVRPDPEHGWPRVFPWPGQPVPAGHPLRTLARRAAVTRRSFWRMPWGEEADYYLDAVAAGNWTVAVLSATDLWNAERLHVEQPRRFDDRPVREVRCCGEVRPVRGYPCPNCREPFCPKCGRCRCDRQAAAEQICQRCFVRYLPHLLVNGLCEECRS